MKTDFKTEIAYVFQEPELLSQLTIAENIALPLTAYLKKKLLSNRRFLYCKRWSWTALKPFSE